MLGKLMKYEWKATWKLLLPMNAFILVMSLFAFLTVKAFDSSPESDIVFMSGVMVVLFYLLSMFVVAVGTAIYLIYRFYTSVYGEQGYLLHTLPVDKHHIIIAKVLTSTLWVCLSAFLITCSWFLMSVPYSLPSGLSSYESITELMREMIESYIGELGAGVVGSGFTIIMALFASFFTLLARVLKVAACISLGQISSNHKVLVSFAFYYGIYIVQHIFRIIFYYIFSVFDDTSLFFYQGRWEISLMSGILYSVAFYLITWYFMEKKLNLD